MFHNNANYFYLKINTLIGFGPKTYMSYVTVHDFYTESGTNAKEWKRITARRWFCRSNTAIDCDNGDILGMIRNKNNNQPNELFFAERVKTHSTINKKKEKQKK